MSNARLVTSDPLETPGAVVLPASGAGTGPAPIAVVVVDAAGLLPGDMGYVGVGGGGGGGGGAATIADGADVAQGTTTDASTANTVIGRLKKLISLLPAALGSATSANSLPVVVASDQAAIPVGGTVTANAGSGTMAVSAATLPLPAGAAQDGTDGTGIAVPTGGAGIRGWLSGIYKRLAPGQTTMSASIPVAIASDQSALPISDAVSDAAYIAPGGTTAPGRVVVVEGKTNDGTPQYQPLPLTAGGASVKTDSSATTQPTSVADGQNVTIGTTTDAATANTVIGRLKKLLSVLPAALGSTTGANSLPVVIASDQGAVPVSLAANQTVNNAQVAGTAVDVNSGTKSAGTQRVVLATDQPALTNALKVDGSAVTQPVSGTVTITPPAYTAPVCGELAGSTAALQLPSVACKLVRFKATAANAGKVYLGITGVTKVDGTTDTSTGMQLQAGDDTGWIPVDNLNRLFRICDNAGDSLTYLALA